MSFRILRSIPDSEDTVQEAWLRWNRSERYDLASPEAFFTTIVTRLSLDELRRVRARRETPLEEQWTAGDGRHDPQVSAELSASISEALFVLLQRLSPLEGGAIMLRDIFGVPYLEAAGYLGRTEATVRQLVSRGRRHLRKPTIRFAVDDAIHATAVRTFRTVCDGGDLVPLLEILLGDRSTAVPVGR